ncbi:hypothetical protein AAFF_G00007200 [Aldrovandia affinis]|uniref:Uncharacterized protein n=1 Tax=Aldrovandia affinis TaxID=143900 RepID=A0AAD7T5Z9_9TELE|nr:hypothetical protein AAFF_G00007200 [Aldrovandia affinis]
MENKSDGKINDKFKEAPRLTGARRARGEEPSASRDDSAVTLAASVFHRFFPISPHCDHQGPRRWEGFSACRAAPGDGVAVPIANLTDKVMRENSGWIVRKQLSEFRILEIAIGYSDDSSGRVHKAWPFITRDT